MKIKFRFLNIIVTPHSKNSSGDDFSECTCQQAKQSDFISDCQIANNRNDGLFYRVNYNGD